MKELTMEKISRTMSHALRHAPEAYSLVLSPEGFVSVAELASALSSHFKQKVSIQEVLDVVAADSKQRYTVSGKRIRAAQGHSIAVQLGLTPADPPAVLFHGTVWSVVDAISKQGLLPGKRQFVHLSAATETAEQVGARRGTPVILMVDAVAAQQDGVVFFQAENGVWLAEKIPSKFISVPS